MKRTILIVVLCVMASLTLMVWGFYGQQEDNATETPIYALVLAEDRGTAAMQLKQGAQAAAEAIGAELRIMTAGQAQPEDDQLLDVLDQLALLRVAGLILPQSAEPVMNRAEALSLQLRIPRVILWATSVDGASSVRTDYRAEGVALAEACLASAGRSCYVLTAQNPASQERLAGVQSVLGSDAVITTAGRIDPATWLGGLPEDAAVMILDAALTAVIADANDGRLPLWGIDPGDARVPLLQEEKATGLMMEMPYAQGYLAVTALHSAAQGEEPGAVYSPSRLITRDAMYLSENVKLVFPLLQ